MTATAIQMCDADSQAVRAVIRIQKRPAYVQWASGPRILQATRKAQPIISTKIRNRTVKHSDLRPTKGLQCLSITCNHEFNGQSVVLLRRGRFITECGAGCIQISRPKKQKIL